MSIFNELLPKICEISNAFTKNFNDDLKAAFLCFDKFEEEFQNGKAGMRDKSQKDKHAMTTLQSINEDDDESAKTSEESGNGSVKSNNDRTSTESTERRGSKKRSKNEVDGMESPEQDKRQKRNASVKAQSIISKQVNVNLNQKLRRENSMDKSGRSKRRGKEDDKENTEPIPVVQVKQEKISLPPEPMDMESLPLNVEVKQESDKDEMAMPPPMAPVPKPRKMLHKEKTEEIAEPEETGRRRTTRTRKQTDTQPAPYVVSNRSTRASARATTKQTDSEDSQPAETRPKRTRAKKAAEPTVSDKDNQTATVTEAASPAEKQRPKRTRRAQKAAEKEKEMEKVEQTQETLVISPKEERISVPEVHSPVLIIKKNDTKSKTDTKTIQNKVKENDTDEGKDKDGCNTDLDKTKVICLTTNSTEISNDMDKTVVLPNGLYNHAPITPKNIRQMNETVVLETCNQTVVLDKPQTNAIMDATVVIDKDPKTANITQDNSLLTDDNDSIEHTPTSNPSPPQPTSAVKAKVQQFEEMATRVTRTKTRAMAKKEESSEQTPPDKVSKAILSAETLSKMNCMIFNGKAPQVSSSATKARVIPGKSFIPSSTSKLSAINKAREAEENQKMEKEDPRSKKEALLEAKRELQKKRREEKMAAAAAARSAAERERKALLEAAAKERREKQAHADLGKLERLREAERKKQELARKVAETEERRKAEEQARQQRLADEQKRAEAARKKQLEEAEAMKKEAALMAKEIERRQKEFMERQKMKQRIDGDKILTPLKNVPAPEPVYMMDGFQYLNSDEDEEPPERPIPAWSTSKARRQQLVVQARVPPRLVDRLFSVRAHSPDLREIFPDIERARLKRTSSAVWRTPPRLPPVRE
ncbi:axoneme-associated protein mst101(2)-like [Melitaea cinxia]|uniref:axoneme-associated protein mst101(2)-like n=1 Tax=Melitaea cinxia TaxID=113334 RepID=UPI001E2742B9|nr:axoneme-associated protein mst101(2)-like [Melitaea cinxia]